MAEGLFNAAPPAGWRARSAGTEPRSRVRDEAVAVMREIGIDLSGSRPKGLEAALGPDVAVLVGLCAEEACPAVPGIPSLHWPVPDPRPGDLDQFRRIRDDLHRRIAQFKAHLGEGALKQDPGGSV